MTITLAGLFDDYDEAELTIDELLDQDIPGDNVYMVVNDEDDPDEFYLIQAIYEDEDEAGDDEDRDDVTGDLSAGETEMGDLMAILTDLGLARQAGRYAEEVRNGMTLLAVKVEEAEAGQVEKIIRRHRPVRFQGPEEAGSGAETGEARVEGTR